MHRLFLRPLRSLPSASALTKPAPVFHQSPPCVRPILPPPSAFAAQTRPYHDFLFDEWKKGLQYIALEGPEKTNFVPEKRGKVTDVASFMAAIGRDAPSVAEKFKDWDHLFTATSKSMKTDLGIKLKLVKYILRWREWYRRGLDPYEIPIPVRQKRMVKEKKRLSKLKRLRKGYTRPE
ncbi:hypothetical protein HK104_000381 [Borealophlyctis nickersoniae]|nr:hypothetical protein HK104_000381 [Borealophlyctis nickersoniae]